MSKQACFINLALALGAGAVSAAEEATPPPSLEEVVITSERRSTNLQTTGISASVLTGADLTNKGIMSVDGLQAIAPSVVIENFGQGNDFNIRGIGKGEHNTQTSTGVIGHLRVKGASVRSRYCAKDLVKSGGEWLNRVEMEEIIGRLPEKIIHIERMPLAATGKIDEVRLREQYNEAAGDRI